MTWYTNVGPCRVLYSTVMIANHAVNICTILNIDPGEDQYKAIDPWRDLGHSKTGWSWDRDWGRTGISLPIGASESGRRAIEDELQGEFCLAIVWQSIDRKFLKGIATPCARLVEYDIRRSGECSTWPLKFETVVTPTMMKIVNPDQPTRT